MCDIVAKKFTFAISSPDEFLLTHALDHSRFHFRSPAIPACASVDSLPCSRALSHVRSPPRPSTDSLACPSHPSPGPGLARASSRIRRCSGRLRTVGHGRHLVIQIRKWFIYPLSRLQLDASKAFDRINHEKLFVKLPEHGAPQCFISVLLNWYSKLTSCVRWNGILSGVFSVGCGVRQGGYLSPFFVQHLC